MVANKHITKITVILVSLAVLVCFLALMFPSALTKLAGEGGVSMEYETKLFDKSQIIDIDILMDSDKWDEMLQNALTEEYYSCDVTVNGEKIKNVAIRPKGNTSLSSIAMNPDTDRFSLKLEFDHFEEGQTCFGLDKLILNNNYADATNMKEAIVYDMFGYLDADASLYNYAKISVNGEYKGIYLALEGVEQSFLLRNFGTQDGELYKPDSMEMGGGNKDKSDFKKPEGDFKRGERPDFGNMKPGERPSMGGAPQGDMPKGENAPQPPEDFDPQNMPDTGDFDPSNMPDFDPSNMPDFDPSNMPDPGDFDPSKMPDMGGGPPGNGDNKEGGRGGFGGGRGGANLNYTDDDLDSYETIWDGEITKTGKKDHRRVVTALKNISEGNDLEKYLDVDNILRYMAAHTFAVNMDSLSGNMAHNYYLYEYKGRLNMFPWDYNLSFGGMMMGRSGGATDMVNDAIDTPFGGTKFFDKLLENEEYLEKYHGYLRELTENYAAGGEFDKTYERIRSQIDELVKTDPTAFYSYDEYDTAAKTLYETVKLRAKSIDGQLSGTIPSTDEGQKEDSSALIDASHIDVKTMGQFSMGGFGGKKDDSEAAEDGEETEDGVIAEKNVKANKRDRAFGNPPFSGVSEEEANANKTKNLIMYGICLALMLAALLVLKCLKRRR